MNYLSLEILRFIILCLHLIKLNGVYIVSFIILILMSLYDCNVFRRQIQSTINKGCLMLHEMQVDKQHFPVNTKEFQQPKVLVWPHKSKRPRAIFLKKIKNKIFNSNSKKIFFSFQIFYDIFLRTRFEKITYLPF
jgi:hypothetical protein